MFKRARFGPDASFVVKMSVRMVLQSTHSPSVHADNKPYDFRVHLPRPLTLLGDWTISLTEFSLKLQKAVPPSVRPELYVCSNLCDDTVVGETELPLLRRVFAKRYTNIIYEVPYEVPLRIGRFGDVHIYIRDSNNQPASQVTRR